jgi:IrrE N-terminal-like domain
LSAQEASERHRTRQGPAFDPDGRPAVVVRGFTLERVFRYEDTTGEDLPAAPVFGHATGDTDAWDGLAALVAGHGFTLTAEPETGGARGHTNYTHKIVNVAPGHPLAERVHILLHELGHIRCGHEQRRDVGRAQRETEAESVAFIVCAALGLDVADPAAVYVGGWTDGDTDTITAAQAAIHQAARGLLADLDQNDRDLPEGR